MIIIDIQHEQNNIMHSIIDVATETRPELTICFLDEINDKQSLVDQINHWKLKNKPVLLYCLDNFVNYSKKIKTIESEFDKFYFTTPGEHADKRHISNVDYLTRFSCGKHHPLITHDCEKKYRFLFLVGKTHQHRLLLLEALAKRGILEHTLLSLRNEGHAYKHILPKQVDLPSKYEWHEISELGGFRAGWHKTNDPMAIAYNKHIGEAHPLLYQDTAYSIVSETNTEPGINYITEKTWTPIVAEHIIVSQGNKGNNGFLERLGFKVINDFISPYNETDHEHVANICQQLNETSIKSLYKYTADQRRHNRSLALDEAHWKKYHKRQLAIK
jgi:hypothetical protein